MSDPQATAITVQDTDPQREYVAGSAHWLAYRAAVRALPHAIDDLERELGDDLYTRMMTDPVVSGCVGLLVESALSSGIAFAPAETPEGDAAAQTAAEEAAAFVWRCVDALQPSLADVLRDMAQDALTYGAKLAEQVYAPGVDDDAGRLVLARIKPKARQRVAFAVDAYDNVVGIYGYAPGLGLQTSGPPLPRSKFAVLINAPKDSDPRGTTALRPAYNYWWIKTQLLPEILKFGAQFGTPSIVGTTPERAISRNAGTTPEEELLNELLEFQSGTALAVPYGTVIKVLEAAQNGGESFYERMIDLCDRQISTAITGTARATQEAQHGSRADSQTAVSLFDALVAGLQQRIAAMLQRDVVAPLLAYNNATWAAYPPVVSVGGTKAEDRSAAWTAAANLERSGYLDPSQYSELDALLGLPTRTPEEIAARQERRTAAPVAPAQPDDDESEDTDDALA